MWCFSSALVCFSQAWLFSTELNSCSPCHLGTSHGGPSHAIRLTGTSDTVFLLILFQVLASTGPPVGLHSYIPFHPSAVVQKRRLRLFCGGGNGEMFEYDACKSRSSESGTGASQPRASKAGEAGMEEEAGCTQRSSTETKGCQVQESTTTGEKHSSFLKGHRIQWHLGLDQCQPQLTPWSVLVTLQRLTILFVVPWAIWSQMTTWNN